LAKVHNDFERIHPNLDGNGRSGRLLLNLLLVRLGYPPAIVFKNERTKYLTAMRKADRGDYGPLGDGHRSRSHQQPLQVRRAGRRRPGPTRATREPGRREGGHHHHRASRRC
jgi:fido (protein-threonine AMPylation protein)